MNWRQIVLSFLAGAALLGGTWAVNVYTHWQPNLQQNRRVTVEYRERVKEKINLLKSYTDNLQENSQWVDSLKIETSIIPWVKTVAEHKEWQRKQDSMRVADSLKMAQQGNQGPTLGAEQTLVVNTGGLAANTVEENDGAQNIISSDDLEMGAFAAFNPNCGVRFPSVALPKYSASPVDGLIGEITEVKVQFTQKESTSGGTVVVEIKGIDEDNTPIFNTTSGDFGGRARTTATVQWDLSAVPYVAGNTNANSQSPDLKAIVQEILSRAGWASGNAMAFSFNNKAGNDSYRNAASSTHATYGEPEITIKYKLWQETSPGGPPEMPGDYILDIGPDLYYDREYNPAAVSQGDAIPALIDKSGNGFDGSVVGTIPTLNIGTNGDRQITWKGGSYYNFGKPALLDYIPGTDNFAMIVQVGDVETGTGYYIAKASAAAATRTYGIFRNPTHKIIIGGTTINIPNADKPHALIIAVVNASTVDVWVNGVKEVTAASIGTNNSDVDGNIGGRSNGLYVMDNNTHSGLTALFGKLLTDEQVAQISTQFCIKGSELNPDIDGWASGGWIDTMAIANVITGDVLKFEAEGQIAATANNWQLYINGFWETKRYAVSFQARQITGSGFMQIGREYDANVFDQAVTSEWKWYHVVVDMTASGQNRLTMGGRTAGDEFEIRQLSIKEIL